MFWLINGCLTLPERAFSHEAKDSDAKLISQIIHDKKMKPFKLDNIPGVRALQKDIQVLRERIYSPSGIY